MEHKPHPHIEARKLQGVATIAKELNGFNGWLAVRITNTVGTMWCAYAFAALTLISLPEAIKGGAATLIAWIAQTFLQLVLLSIIMVGQKVAAAASDKLAPPARDLEARSSLFQMIHWDRETPIWCVATHRRRGLDRPTALAARLTEPGPSRSRRRMFKAV